MAQVPDVLGEIPSSWALPCVPAAGIQAGMLHRPAHRLAGLDRVRAGRTPIIPSGPAASGARSRTSPSSPPRRPPFPPGRTSSSRPPARTCSSSATHRQLQPPAESSSSPPAGAMIVVNETGIYISNGQGATITLIGPAVAINEPTSPSWAHDGDLMPAPDPAHGSHRSLLARRPGHPHRTQPAWSWSPACPSRPSPRPMPLPDAPSFLPPAMVHASPAQWIVGAVVSLRRGSPSPS